MKKFALRNQLSKQVEMFESNSNITLKEQGNYGIFTYNIDENLNLKYISLIKPDKNFDDVLEVIEIEPLKHGGVYNSINNLTEEDNKIKEQVILTLKKEKDIINI